MFINAILFGIVIAFLWFGLKVLWTKGRAVRWLVVVLSLPILAFIGLLMLTLMGVDF